MCAREHLERKKKEVKGCENQKGGYKQ